MVITDRNTGLIINSVEVDGNFLLINCKLSCPIILVRFGYLESSLDFIILLSYFTENLELIKKNYMVDIPKNIELYYNVYFEENLILLYDAKLNCLYRLKLQDI